MYVYIYICIFTYVCIYVICIYMCVCICMYIYIYILYIHIYIWDKPTEWGLASSGLLTAYDSWQGPSSSSQNPPTDCSYAYNIFQIPTTMTAMLCIYIIVYNTHL